MLSFQNIKNYIVSIFALLFVFLANNTSFAIEKENIIPSQNCLEVELTKQVVDSALNRIASGGKFPHRNDGSIFKNLEGLLPEQNTGFYREFVHPTPGVAGPGPMRIVTGQNGQMWFTPDHYKTFIPIR